MRRGPRGRSTCFKNAKTNRFGVPRGGGWRQQYTFDAFGNINQIRTCGNPGTCSWWDTRTTTTSPATNRLTTTGTQYDSAGNMTRWQRDGGVVTEYLYYPSNQIRLRREGGQDRTLYAYTASGERLAQYDLAADVITLTLRGLDDKVLAVYELQGGTLAWRKDYVYANGRHLGAVSQAEGVRHFTVDHLGSIRLITNPQGTVVGYHAYDPFGEEAGTTPDGEVMKFTGHERDFNGSNTATMQHLDSMHARYYNPNLARFLSPDPGRDNHPSRPQSWNLYAYVTGNPLKFVDPTGLSSLSPFKEAVKDPRFGAVLSMGASLLAEHASRRLPPGKGRGLALTAAGVLSAHATATAAVASGCSVVAAFGSVKTGVGPLAGVAGASFFGGLAVWNYVQSVDQLGRAYSNLVHGVDPADQIIDSSEVSEGGPDPSVGREKDAAGRSSEVSDTSNQVYCRHAGPERDRRY